MPDKLTFSFTYEQWRIISNSLYFANNRLGKAKLAGGKFEDQARVIQHEINTTLRVITEDKTCFYAICRDDKTGNFLPTVISSDGVVLYRGEDYPLGLASELLAAEAARNWARPQNIDLRRRL